MNYDAAAFRTTSVVYLQRTLCIIDRRKQRKLLRNIEQANKLGNVSKAKLFWFAASFVAPTILNP